MAKIRHQYKLTDSLEQKEMQIAGVNLNKNWATFPNTRDQLLPFLKSTTNPNGMIDYRKVDMESNEVLYKTVTMPKDMPIFEKNILFIMTRNELCDICKEYGIVTTNRTNQFLVKEILEKQERIKEQTVKEVVEIVEETNEIEIEVETIKPEKQGLLDRFKK